MVFDRHWKIHYIPTLLLGLINFEESVICSLVYETPASLVYSGKGFTILWKEMVFRDCKIPWPGDISPVVSQGYKCSSEGILYFCQLLEHITNATYWSYAILVLLENVHNCRVQKSCSTLTLTLFCCRQHFAGIV